VDAGPPATHGQALDPRSATGGRAPDPDEPLRPASPPHRRAAAVPGVRRRAPERAGRRARARDARAVPADPAAARGGAPGPGRAAAEGGSPARTSGPPGQPGRATGRPACRAGSSRARPRRCVVRPGPVAPGDGRGRHRQEADL
jgi:hypothetical protein